MRAAWLLLVVVACASPAPAPKPASPPASASPARTHLRILATADEHGWLFPLKDKKAGVRKGGVLEAYEALTAAGLGKPDVVLLSAGDMWTGPYESTLVQGAPMHQAMERLGYRAAAIGNHDFDFGQKVLGERNAQSSFPFLSANVVDEKTGEPAPFAKPFAIVDVAGKKLGVVGLSPTDAVVTTDVKNLAGVKILDPAEALLKWVPAARSAGAEIVVVVMHDGPYPAQTLAPVARKLGIAAVLFGHVHKAAIFVDDNATLDRRDDVVACNGGPYLRSFCVVDLEFEGPALVDHDVELQQIERPIEAPVTGEPGLRAILDDAQATADREGGEVLIEAMNPLERGNGKLGRLVVESWLKSFPAAKAAITNKGGLRQDLQAGPVRVKDVVGVLPFSNTLFVVEMSKADLADALSNDEAVHAGVRPDAVASDERVKVVISDFLYRGGDHFRFRDYDPDPEETGVDWREPVFRELRRLGAEGKRLE